MIGNKTVINPEVSIFYIFGQQSAINFPTGHIFFTFSFTIMRNWTIIGGKFFFTIFAISV